MKIFTTVRILSLVGLFALPLSLLVFIPQKAAASGRFVQVSSNSSATPAATTLTTPAINTTVGNTQIVAMSWDCGIGQTITITVSDSKSSVWTAATIRDQDSRSLSSCMQIWYAPVTTGGPTTVTMVTSANTNYRNIIVHEVSGLLATSSVDRVATTTTATGAAIAIGPVTPTKNNEYIFAAAADTTNPSTNTFTPGLSFTERAQVMSAVVRVPFETEDYSQPTAASIAATWTLNGTENVMAQMVTFKSIRNVLNKPPNNLGLVGYWSFNEGTSTIATDFSGNNKVGALSTTGAAPPVWLMGKTGMAIKFDGVDDYVSAGNAAASLQTVSFWIKIDVSATEKIIDLDGGTHQIETNASSQITATGFSAPTVYVDGSSASAAIDTGWHFVTITTATPFAASAVNIGRVSAGFFGGVLDEVRFYSRALSASEVAVLYGGGITTAVRINTSTANLQKETGLGTGLIGFWTFDGADIAGSVLDRSGQGNNGFLSATMPTTTAQAIGVRGQALTFDATNDSVNVGDINATDGASVLTFSQWIYSNSLTGNQSMISKSVASDEWNFATNGPGGNDTVVFTFTIGINGYTSNHEHQAGIWEHWVVVYDGTQTGNAARLKFYKNGVAQTMVYGGTIPATTASTANVIRIGATSGGTAVFNGRIDDVRIYSRALSVAEIVRLYQLGQTTIKR